jgi:hypothetical protein
VREGKPANFMGYARNYGIPIDWTVQTLMYGNAADKDKTMTELLSSRIVTGLNANGGAAQAVALAQDASDAEAEALLAQHQATNLLTLHVRNWHFDVNINWVGAFRFDSDMDVIVQRAGAGTVLRETFTDSQAIQGVADNSWGNMILDAYREKLQQTLNDPDVRTALTTAPVAAPAEAEAAPTS